MLAYPSISCISMCLCDGGWRNKILLQFFIPLYQECINRLLLGLCIFSKDASLPQPVCHCVSDRSSTLLAHCCSFNLSYLSHNASLSVSPLSFSTTSHSHAGFHPPLPIHPIHPCLKQRTVARVQFSSSGVSPFVFVKSSLTADLILCAVLLTVEKVAELLSVDRKGQIVQAQPRRHNVKLSPGPSKWKALFRTLLPLEVINPSAGKLVICVKGLSYIYKASEKK